MIRVLLRCLLALAAAGASTFIGWRVLAPAELLSPSRSAYPAAPRRSWTVNARTNQAFLIVDGRIRVYASPRQVRADWPLDYKAALTPAWSFRRWPQQLDGVVALGRTVVTRWSDGDLVAINGRSGRISWRVRGPRGGGGYGGHQTGASTVWTPPGMHTASGDVLISSGQTVTAYAGTTGARMWSETMPAGCADGFTTSGGAYVCSTGAYDARTGNVVPNWPSGPYTAVACAVAESGCAAIRDGAKRGWRVNDLTPSRLALLDHAGSTLAAGQVFSRDHGGLRSVDVLSGAVHTYPAATVLGASYGNVVLLLNGDHALMVADPKTGQTLSDLVFAGTTDPRSWKLGLYQLIAGHVAIERLRAGGPVSPGAAGHYLAGNAVILASV